MIPMYAAFHAALQRLQLVFSSAASFVGAVLLLVGGLIWMALLQLSVNRTSKLIKEISANMATKKDLEVALARFDSHLTKENSV